MFGVFLSNNVFSTRESIKHCLDLYCNFIVKANIQFLQSFENFFKIRIVVKKVVDRCDENTYSSIHTNFVGND